jgi:hypothetical protein
MNTNKLVESTGSKSRVWLSVVIGLPILMSMVMVLAYIGWLLHGYPAEASPSHWLSEPIFILGLAMSGGIVSFFAASCLLIVGAISRAIGEGLTQKWQRVSKRSHSSH